MWWGKIRDGGTEVHAWNISTRWPPSTKKYGCDYLPGYHKCGFHEAEGDTEKQREGIAVLMLGGSKSNPKGVPELSLVGGVNSLTTDLSQSGRKAVYIVQQGRNSQCDRMTLRYRASELEVGKCCNCVHWRLQVGSPTAAASHIIISRIESDENAGVVNLESTKMSQRPFTGNVRQLAS